MTFNADEVPVARFCAPQYVAQKVTGPSALEKIIVLVVGYESGALRVLSHRDWPSIVPQKHLGYIRDFLADFRQRAHSSPGRPV
jgi:hypothetical protein